MASRSPLYLNLHRTHCLSLSLDGQVRIDPERESIIRAQVQDAGQATDGTWRFEEEYRIAGRLYTIHANFAKIGEDNLYRLHLVHSERIQPVREKRPPVVPLMEALARGSETEVLHSHATFSYAESDGTSTLALPMLATTDQSKEAVEVRGLRLTVLNADDRSELFSIIVDRPSNEIFYHTVETDAAITIDRTFITEIFELSSRASQRFFKVSERRQQRRSRK